MSHSTPEGQFLNSSLALPAEEGGAGEEGSNLTLTQDDPSHVAGPLEYLSIKVILIVLFGLVTITCIIGKSPSS